MVCIFLKNSLEVFDCGWDSTVKIGLGIWAYNQMMRSEDLRKDKRDIDDSLYAYGCVWRKNTSSLQYYSGDQHLDICSLFLEVQRQTQTVKAWVPKRKANPLFFHVREHPLKNMVNRGIFDSGCSGNMTGVNTPGSDENRLKLYDLMYKIVKVADTRVKDC
ncbi:hypothetical protein Tco_0437751 [Tanacetum coccineum]